MIGGKKELTTNVGATVSYNQSIGCSLGIGHPSK